MLVFLLRSRRFGLCAMVPGCIVLWCFQVALCDNILDHTLNLSNPISLGKESLEFKRLEITSRHCKPLGGPAPGPATLDPGRWIPAPLLLTFWTVFLCYYFCYTFALLNHESANAERTLPRPLCVYAGPQNTRPRHSAFGDGLNSMSHWTWEMFFGKRTHCDHTMTSPHSLQIQNDEIMLCNHRPVILPIVSASMKCCVIMA